jgi:hypothetical protein
VIELFAREKWAESGVRGSRRLRTGEWIDGDVQAGKVSSGGQSGSGRVGESMVRLDSAVEREEEREGNSGSGRGDRQRRDGEVSWDGGWSASGSGGSGGGMSVEHQSGHAPGKDGVGEGACIVKEKKMKTKVCFWVNKTISNYKVPLTARETLSAK